MCVYIINCYLINNKKNKKQKVKISIFTLPLLSLRARL